MPRSKKQCPVCGFFIVNVSQHLLLVHKIYDPQERRLMLSRANARYSAALVCPKPECNNRKFTRLDMHLSSVHKIGTQEVRQIMKRVKAETIECEIQKVRSMSRASPINNTFLRQQHQQLKNAVLDMHRKISAMDSLIRLVGTAKSNREQQAGMQPQWWVELLAEQEGIPPVDHEPLTQQSGASAVEPEPSPPAHSSHAEVLEAPREKQGLCLPSETTLSSHILSMIINMRKSSLHESKFSKAKQPSKKEKVTQILKLMCLLCESTGSIDLNLDEWVKKLRDEGTSPALIKCYVLYVQGFMKRFRKNFVIWPGAWVAREKMRNTVQTLKKQAKALKIQQKDRGVLDVTQIGAFLLKTQALLRVALLNLVRRPENTERLRRCVAFLAGFMFCAAGLPKKVVVHLTPDVFEDVETEDNLFVISVNLDEASVGSVTIKIPLLTGELHWFQAFLKIRPLLPGFKKNPKTLFFSSSGAPMQNIEQLVLSLWKDLRLEGDFTITGVRAAISDVCQRKLSEDQYAATAQAICHDIKTAQCFYAADACVQESFRRKEMLKQWITERMPAAGQTDEGAEETSTCSEESESEETEGSASTSSMETDDSETGWSDFDFTSSESGSSSESEGSDILEDN
ncbi:hypothetical protein GN956_G25302 [Arapaima gigas]